MHKVMKYMHSVGQQEQRFKHTSLRQHVQYESGCAQMSLSYFVVNIEVWD